MAPEAPRAAPKLRNAWSIDCHSTVDALDSELAALGGQSNAVVTACREASLEAAADALLAAVRLPGGGLQDDVSLVLCRRE